MPEYIGSEYTIALQKKLRKRQKEFETDKDMVNAGVKLAKQTLNNLTDDERVQLNSLLSAVRSNLLELDTEKTNK